MSAEENIKKLIKEHKRRLQKLREMEARLGINTPPEISIEIEDIQTKIAELQAELTTLDDSNLGMESSGSLSELNYEKNNFDLSKTETPKLTNKKDGPKRARILFLDDHPDWQQQVGKLLNDHDYNVTVTTSAAETIRYLNSDTEFDLAIFDMRLDEENEMDRSGIMLARNLRDQGYELPIIILTAYDPESEILIDLTRPPYNFPMVEKGKIVSGDYDGLFYQLESAIPWQQRPIRCFVAMPYGDGFDDVFSEIHDTLQQLGIVCLRADKDRQAGYIPGRIQKHLRHNSFVIADLTKQNPNVFYELGYAYIFNRPMILLRQENQEPLVDFSAFYTIEYNLKHSGIQNLKQELKDAVEKTLNEPRPTSNIRQSVRPIFASTYVQFIPDSPLGREARKELVGPVIEELQLQQPSIHNLGSRALRIDENVSNIQNACVVLAEISEADPETYFYVGISDALKETGLLLLIRHDKEPPFNLRGRANTIKYDPLDFKKVRNAQIKLKNRVKGCLQNYKQIGSEDAMEQKSAVISSAFQSRKMDVRQALNRLYKETVAHIETYMQKEKSPRKRAILEKEVRAAKEFVGKESERLLEKIEAAESQEKLNQLEQQLSTLKLRWLEYVLRKFPL